MECEPVIPVRFSAVALTAQVAIELLVDSPAVGLCVGAVAEADRAEEHPAAHHETVAPEDLDAVHVRAAEMRRIQQRQFAHARIPPIDIPLAQRAEMELRQRAVRPPPRVQVAEVAEAPHGLCAPMAHDHLERLGRGHVASVRCPDGKSGPPVVRSGTYLKTRREAGETTDAPSYGHTTTARRHPPTGRLFVRCT